MIEAITKIHTTSSSVTFVCGNVYDARTTTNIQFIELRFLPSDRTESCLYRLFAIFFVHKFLIFLTLNLLCGIDGYAVILDSDIRVRK